MCFAAVLVLLLVPAPPSPADYHILHLTRSPFGYPVSFGAGDVVCSGTHRIQLLYGVIEHRPDNFTYAKPRIQQEAMNMSGILNTEAELKSNETRGARMRFVCDGDGRPSVSHAGTFPAGVDAPDSAQGAYVYGRLLCQRGFNRTDRIYLVVLEQHDRAYAAAGACPGSRHAFVGAERQLLSSYVDHQMMLHETLHSMGAVARGAPGSDGDIHCVESRDVMCYPQRGSEFCRERMQVDCREDTYFDPTPEPGEWLALNPQHNLAHCANVWIDCTYVNRGPSFP